VRDGADPSRPRAVACERCDALNGAGFDRCIRCGAALSPLARSADRLRGGVDPEHLLATKAILVLTFLAFVVQTLMRMRRGEELHAILLPENSFSAREMLQFEMARQGALRPTASAVGAEPWRLLSAMFVHRDVLHLLLNMMVFRSVARDAEPMLGSARLILVYLATGAAGFAASIAAATLSHANAPGLMLGASGACFGVMGLVLGYLLRRRSPQLTRFAVRVVLVSVLLTFAIGQIRFGVLTNHVSHFAGLAVGFVFGIFYASSSPRRSRSEMGVNLIAAIGLVACVISLVLAQLSFGGLRGRGGSSDPATIAPAVDSVR
jgi:rhomboid protease GluP